MSIARQHRENALPASRPAFPPLLEAAPCAAAVPARRPAAAGAVRPPRRSPQSGGTHFKRASAAAATDNHFSLSDLPL